MTDPYILLLEEITINAPLRDLFRGPQEEKEYALEYLQGKHPDAPFQPPEDLVEILNGAKPAELEAFKEAGTSCKAKDVLEDIWRRQHGRPPVRRTRSRTPGRPADEEKQRERLEAAPYLTLKEFMARFQICENTAREWSRRHNIMFKGAKCYRRRG